MTNKTIKYSVKMKNLDWTWIRYGIILGDPYKADWIDEIVSKQFLLNLIGILFSSESQFVIPNHMLISENI